MVILLFLYSTVQKSAVQYSIRPNLEFIYKIIAVIIYIYTSCEWIAMYGPVQYPQRIEWSQSLNCLIVCLSVLCLLVSKFSHFFLFHPPLFIQYSTEECSTVQLFIYKIIAVMIDIDTS